MLEEQRSRICTVAHRLAAEGLVMGTVGNLSVRVGEQVAVTATGTTLAILVPEQITVLSLADGRVIDGGLKPTSEVGLHLGLYRRYPEAGAIVHTHAPWATALSCVVDELPCIHYQMLPLGGAVRVAPYRTFGTPELAEATLTALDGRSAALMSNHGAIVHAGTIEQALESALVLEYACCLYWRARQIGTPRVLDATQWQEVSEQVRKLGYGVTHALDEREK
jgi:L-fuculose-phosphate aldolase